MPSHKSMATDKGAPANESPSADETARSYIRPSKAVAVPRSPKPVYPNAVRIIVAPRPHIPRIWRRISHWRSQHRSRRRGVVSRSHSHSNPDGHSLRISGSSCEEQSRQHQSGAQKTHYYPILFHGCLPFHALLECNSCATVNLLKIQDLIDSLWPTPTVRGGFRPALLNQPGKDGPADRQQQHVGGGNWTQQWFESHS